MLTEKTLIYAARFRNLLKENNKRQKDVATQLGLSQQCISDLTNGRREFSAGIISGIAKFFKITVAEFIDSSPVNINHSSHDPGQNNQYDNLKDNSLVQNLIHAKNDTNQALQKTISVLEHRISELEEKIKRRDVKIEELKLNRRN